MENIEKNRMSIGSMDFFRGFGIIAITIGHTIVYYNYENMPLVLLGLAGLSLYAVINAFMLSSGIGFRPQKIKKCIKQQHQFLIKTYWVSALLIIVIFALIRIILWHDWNTVVVSEMPTLLALILGLNGHQDRVYNLFGFEVADSGTLWFVLGLALATIILNIVMNRVKEKRQLPVLIILSLIGFSLTKLNISLPFCLERGMFYALTIYVGYMIKKHKLMQKKLPVWSYILMAIVWALGTVWENVLSLSKFAHIFDFFNIYGYLCAGFLLLKLFITADFKFGNKLAEVNIVRQIKFIGRNSIWFYCIHAIEGAAIPWYLFADRFDNRPLLGSIIQFICRWCLINVGFLCFKKIQALKKKNS